MRRYLTFWLALTGCLILLVGAINLVVDPYGLFRLVEKPGFNSVKPKSGVHGGMVKAYQVLRVQPHGLILGNSRAEVGFDPTSAAWPDKAQPVFNLALPGTGTRTSLQYLQHVLASVQAGKANKPEVVVWGVDLMDFLLDASVSPGLLNKIPQDRRLLNDPFASRNPGRVVQQMRDYAEATFTLGAFQDSVQTVMSQQDEYAEDLTPLDLARFGRCLARVRRLRRRYLPRSLVPRPYRHSHLGVRRRFQVDVL